VTITSIDLDEARLAEISELLTTMQTTHQELVGEVDALTNTPHATSPRSFPWGIALAAAAVGLVAGMAIAGALF
jgi:hypothetical protein